MAVNMSRGVYLPCQNVFGRPATFTYKAGGSFAGRGIYSSREINLAMDDGSIITDQDTILDIRTEEFQIVPQQDDSVSIPAEPISGLPDEGNFQITNIWHNGGGEITLQLRRIETAG